MNEYWKAPADGEAEVPAEVEFEESGRPGCLSVFAVMLAAGGIGYGIVFGIMGLNMMVNVDDRPVLGAVITMGAIPLGLVPAIVALGLWRLRMWAWWLTVILGSLGLGAAAVSFVGALLGADPARALGFVLGPLMGLLVGGVALTWFLRNRDHFEQEAGRDGSSRVEEGEPESDTENALLVFVVTVMGCLTLFCIVGATLVFLMFVLGVPATFSGIMRSLGLPAP